MSFKPDLKPYNTVGRFKFWCQKVLPTVYDNSLSYYEVLNKIVKYLNDLIENIDTMEDNVDALGEAFGLLEDDVEAFKADVQETLDGYEGQLEQFEARIEQNVDDKLDEIEQEVDDKLAEYDDDVQELIDSVNDTLENFEERFSELETEIENSLGNKPFIPTVFKVKTTPNMVNWVMFNTGEDASNAVPNTPDSDTSLAFCEATFTDTDGSHEPSVYFGLNDNYNLVETTDVIYYAYIYSPNTETIDIFITSIVDTNLRLGETNRNVVGGRVTVIPITGTLINPATIYPVDRTHYLGIKFNTLGSKNIKVALIRHDVNTLFATLYNRALMQGLDNLSALETTVGQMQRLLLPTPPSTDGTWYLRYYKDYNDIRIGWVGPYPLDDEIKPEVTPTTDGRYIAVLTVEDGENTYEWEEYSPSSGGIPLVRENNTNSVLEGV